MQSFKMIGTKLEEELRSQDTQGKYDGKKNGRTNGRTETCTPESLMLKQVRQKWWQKQDTDTIL